MSFASSSEKHQKRVIDERHEICLGARPFAGKLENETAQAEDPVFRPLSGWSRVSLKRRQALPPVGTLSDFSMSMNL